MTLTLNFEGLGGASQEKKRGKDITDPDSTRYKAAVVCSVNLKIVGASRSRRCGRVNLEKGVWDGL